jgi:hypothetical protein
MYVRGETLGLTIFSGEEGLAAQHLGKNASNGPNVNSLSVFLECQHDLRCTVPAGSNVFRHETGVVLLGSSRTSKTEVTYFQVAIGVKEKIGGLQVTMKNIGGVHGLKSAKGLVDEVLAMIVREVLSTDNSVHVRLHQLLYIEISNPQIQLDRNPQI